MKIYALKTYTPEIATRVRELLIQLSRSGKDKGEIPREWFEEIINSPYHDLLIAEDDGDEAISIFPPENSESSNIPENFATPNPKNVLGIASLSVLMGPNIRKNAYLEDFVTDKTVRGKGVGSALWNAMLIWSKNHGCKNLEFTCGEGREKSQEFYKHHGAEIYPTNFFRKKLD